MNDKKLIIATILGVFVLTAAAYFLISASSQPVSKTASYTLSDSERPRAEVGRSSFDLGQMKVSEQKSFDFAIKNTGQKPLQLSNITSSCGCTVAQVLYDGKISGEFGMHSQSEEIFEVVSQKQALVRVIYRPYVMPVYGPVEREVYVTTNDPKNPKLIFKVNARVN